MHNSRHNPPTPWHTPLWRYLRGGALLLGLLVLLFILALVVVFGVSPARHQGAVSDHFDGTRFFNPVAATQTPEAAHQRGFLRGLRWFLFGERAPWPTQIDSQVGPKPLPRVNGEALRITWVNHSTFLIQTAGLNILTDPVWAERVSPVGWYGPQRVRQAGLRLADLPPIDLILISHDHYDHLDLDTLAQLVARDHPRLLYGLGVEQQVGQSIARQGEALDWWQQREFQSAAGNVLRVTFTPAQHFSGRGPLDRNHTLWGSYVLETAHGPLYFAGDTGYGPHFQAIQSRFGAMHLALLPIGAYKPESFMAPVHVSPAQAVQASLDLRAKTSIGMHYATFHLAGESIDAPVQDLKQALAIAQAQGKTVDFRLPTPGQAQDF